jgi:colanic acid biosynthesis glycosyl transferase WcaI
VNNLKILIVHRYYWPDKTPCAGFMHAIAAHLASDGHSVDAVTSQPSYAKDFKRDRRSRSENVSGVNIKRLSLPRETARPLIRIINALYLGMAVIMRSLYRRYDVIIATTIPPVLGGFSSGLAAKLIRARFIYFCMDLHPEVGRISGDFAKPALFHALQVLDDWTCRQAQPVLVHSADMRNTLRQRARGAEYRIELMNNFALPTDHYSKGEVDWQLNKKNIRLRLIYAGNMGRFQGLEIFLDAMGRIARRKDIELIMMGEGVAKPSLIAKQNKTNANVRFFDYQPVETVKTVIQTADIGVVALISGMYRYAYPGKTMAYLEQGRPILAAVETESELAKTMLAEGYGFSVPIGDAEALAELLVRLADDLSWKESMNRSALAAFERHFSAPVVLAKWSQLVGPP